MMYKKIYEKMNQKSTMFLICLGLLAIGVVVGDSSELRQNNSTDNMQNDG